MARKNETTNANASDVARTDASGRKVGEGVGGVGGAVAGGAIGSMAGPIGTAIGAIAGAVGGWWAGREVGEAATGYNDTADRTRFESMAPAQRGRFQSYDQVRPAYQYGYLASRNPDYRGKSFDQVEGDLRRGWNSDVEKQSGYSWNDVRGPVSDAYARGIDTRDEQRITRSEEELVVDKRTVQAGEIELRKTVETEHVKKTVPLMHEEVEIERHAIDGNVRGDVDIGEKDIRIPLSAEEAVVNKRAVGKEEIVVKKRAVEEQKNVEADIRKERIDVDKHGRAKDTDRDIDDEARGR